MAAIVRTPILAMLGAILAVIIIILAFGVFQSSGVGGASISTAIGSATTTTTNLIPFIAALLAGGIGLGALSARGRG